LLAIEVRRAQDVASDAYFMALDECRFEWNPLAPDREPTGTETLGVVGNAAGWLLETESVPIVVVVGMIGFGLLGASFSTFVRERQRRKAGDPLVEDLAGVVIRGLSAAIVVFLGIYGGLSAMTASAEPDPYLVFFICLVGAVFSDVVWEWAQGSLRLQLGKDEALQRKYTVEELSPEKSFYFRGPQDRSSLRAANLRQFVRVADGIDDETWAHHLQAGDYSRWFRDSVMDGVLADEVAEIEGTELNAAESRAKVREAIGRRYPEAVK
jgi:hypothetical protein